ncbi:hypothetical protein DFQ01_11526 [Paenibacillus cellulosilyticus]|uniref:DUF4276 family protein n=1 Tax=Paenibacillus cellulosilyticus TaxID=375489 RepID=A0A2V2YQZ4_9BACL|nr:hypothetical protein [Paenibacillus cellulosilyticus]PWV99310.1 hypothetical protein DFQ01_11526 [Paenibacillus cellulosilyticus]QKS45075.1 hypothetical protein HUB94_12110 [Paenibacillus cellulosilyticus]
MNLYILVEGKSEKHIYPKWLSELLPQLVQVKHLDLITSNNYYLFSCDGYPSIIKDIPNAISDIKTRTNIDYLMIVLDSDDVAVEDRKSEVLSVVQNCGFDPAKILIVVQNHCIETWCLGNQKVFSRNPQTSEFIECSRFYSILENDPELMGIDTNVSQVTTVAQYHEYYLSKMLLERNASYTKGKGSKAVQNPQFLFQMIERIDSTDHLSSFREFIGIIRYLESGMEAEGEAASTSE